MFNWIKKHTALILVMLFICAASSFASAKELRKTQPTPTLLVIKREHCPHCEQWQNDVYAHWQELGLESKLPQKHIRILDAEKEEDMKRLIDLLNAGKIKDDIHFVPTFILLNERDEEIPSCRISGYKNIAGFKQDVQRVLSNYRK